MPSERTVDTGDTFDWVAPAIAAARTGRKCDDCEGNREGDFSYNGHDFCAECMSAFVSWLLDGGVESDPDMYAWVFTEWLPLSSDKGSFPTEEQGLRSGDDPGTSGLAAS
jgi:hypothetical protein